jgi:hypothetical protein
MLHHHQFQGELDGARARQVPRGVAAVSCTNPTSLTTLCLAASSISLSVSVGT